MSFRGPKALGDNLGETKSAAEASKHTPNIAIAITRSMAKKRFVIKVCSPKFGGPILFEESRLILIAPRGIVKPLFKRSSAPRGHRPVPFPPRGPRMLRWHLKFPQHLQGLGQPIWRGR